MSAFISCAAASPLEGPAVGCEALRGLERQPAPGALPKHHAERAGHLGCDVGLHVEDVGERGGERLLPGGAVGACSAVTSTSSGVTRTRVGSAGRLVPLHRGGQQVVGAELAGDLVRRLRRARYWLELARASDLGRRRAAESLARSSLAIPSAK